MAFKFRYDALLTFRQHLKDSAEIELSKCRKKLYTAKEILENSITESLRIRKVMRADLYSKIPAYELQHYADYLNDLKEKISQQALEVSNCEKEVAEKLEDLISKTKDFKVIEKLKEKEFQAWQAHQNQLEQKRQNEITILRYGRKFP